MIVAAQRAYAERESCEMRQTEMKEELAKEAAQWQKTLAEYDAEMEALDEECRARDRELEELLQWGGSGHFGPPVSKSVLS